MYPKCEGKLDEFKRRTFMFEDSNMEKPDRSANFHPNGGGEVEGGGGARAGGARSGHDDAGPKVTYSSGMKEAFYTDQHHPTPAAYATMYGSTAAPKTPQPTFSNDRSKVSQQVGALKQAGSPRVHCTLCVVVRLRRAPRTDGSHTVHPLRSPWQDSMASGGGTRASYRAQHKDHALLGMEDGGANENGASGTVTGGFPCSRYNVSRAGSSVFVPHIDPNVVLCVCVCVAEGGPRKRKSTEQYDVAPMAHAPKQNRHVGQGYHDDLLSSLLYGRAFGQPAAAITHVDSVAVLCVTICCCSPGWIHRAPGGVCVCV